jgi:hypothetical protein
MPPDCRVEIPGRRRHATPACAGGVASPDGEKLLYDIARHFDNVRAFRKSLRNQAPATKSNSIFSD